MIEYSFQYWHENQRSVYEQEKVTLGRQTQRMCADSERASLWGGGVWDAFEKGVGNMVCGSDAEGLWRCGKMKEKRKHGRCYWQWEVIRILPGRRERLHPKREVSRGRNSKQAVRAATWEKWFTIWTSKVVPGKVCALSSGFTVHFCPGAFSSLV